MQDVQSFFDQKIPSLGLDAPVKQAIGPMVMYGASGSGFSVVITCAAAGSGAAVTITVSPDSAVEATEPAETEAGPTSTLTAGEIKNLAHQLVPQGSTEVSSTEMGLMGGYALEVTSAMSMQDLASFYDQKFPSLGMTVASKNSTSDEVLYFAVNEANGVGATVNLTAGDGAQRIEIVVVGSGS